MFVKKLKRKDNVLYKHNGILFIHEENGVMIFAESEGNGQSLCLAK